MKQLIIIFEFQQANSSKLLPFRDLLRKYSNYAFLTTNSCIIWTSDAPATVRDNLKSGVGTDDKLFVGVITAPAAWTLSIGQVVTDYVRKNLK